MRVAYKQMCVTGIVGANEDIRVDNRYGYPTGARILDPKRKLL